MKMWAIAVGFLIALLGASIVANAILHLHLPLVRTALALFLVALGVRIGVRAWTAPRAAPRSAAASPVETQIAPRHLPNGDLQYDVVFGRGVVDLTLLPRLERELTVTVNAIFGTAILVVDPAVPYEISGASLGGSAMSRSPGSPARLHVKVNAVFGGCQVVERQGSPRLPLGGEALPMGTPLG